jgi:hypothetical protein
MESIDIIDSTFTLNTPENMDTLHTSFSNTFLDNYMIIIFIGLFCIGMIVYKYYYRRNINTENTENNHMGTNENMDCPGGFCNMRKNDTTLQEH